ncbi:amino acid adenylation domain-containing protein [Micromonospora sp. CA-263727]|uniref:amino acid adenylation domain-containing protein n=1 Tax=Micromonospora sp. CA-263727 TaxID=3239967 RepID=UPI003D95023E
MTTDDDRLLLSAAQEQLWFVDQLRPGAAVDQLLSAALRLRGPLEVDALGVALTQVATRHAVLRSRYDTVDDTAVMVVDPATPVPLPVADLTALGPAEREHELDRLRAEELRIPIDLGRQAPWRTRLVRLAPDEAVLLVTVHHIAFDGLSWGVLARELDVLYAAASAGRTPELAPLATQYHEVARRERERDGNGTTAPALAYWRERLTGLAPLELPTDRPRPARWAPDGASVPVVVPAELANRLRALGRAGRATPFMVHMAAFQLLLSRYSGQTDIGVGVSTNTRTEPETAGLIGLFVDTVAIRSVVAETAGFTDLVAQVRERVLEALRHAVPFSRVMPQLDPARDAARNPVFQAGFGWAAARRESFRLAGLEVEVCPPVWAGSTFDVSLQLAEHPDGTVVGQFVYPTSLFDRSRVERLAAGYLCLLRSIAQQPDRPVAELELLPAEERERIAGWNRTDLPGPDRSLPALFLDRARSEPDGVAVRWADQQLTYAEVGARVQRLASYLRRHGVVAETPVGVALPRGPQLPVAVLAVLAAGGTYVPLPPEYPAERLAYMISDSGTALILTDSTMEGLPAGVATVDLDAAWDAIATQPPGDLPEIADDQAAYVVYTSGSTGRPKGVVVTHAGIRNRVLWSVRRYAMTAADRLLHKTTIGFDAAVWELLSPLVSGGSIVMAPPDGHRDPAVMTAAITRHEVTIVQVVPSVLRLLAGDPGLARCTSLRLVCSAGEALPAALARRLVALPGIEVVNTYGPTESSIDATAWTFRADDPAETVPIGGPLPNVEVYVVDRADQLAPIGVPGELRLGGVGLARGYLGRPDLTADRFTPNPYATRPGQRWYHTGDVARWREDGALEFLGRTDGQVKVNGVRVETAEIEFVLREHPEVDAAVVIGRSTEAGDTHLVAYVCPAAPADLRDHLAERLPAAMVPAQVVPIGQLPLTPNGKVDRAALLAVGSAADEVTTGLAPETPMERDIAAVMAEILGAGEVGVTDDFFACGGHSLAAIRLVMRLRRMYGVEMTVGDVFGRPTVRGMAEWIDEQLTPTDDRMITPVPRDRPLPLSFAQRRLWFLDQLTPGTAEYLIPLAVRVRGALDPRRLRRAMVAVVRRHEVLRTRYLDRDGEPGQVVDPPGDVAFEQVDLSGRPDAEAAGRELLDRAAGRPFDLATEHPLRVTLIRVGPDHHLLLLALHHIAFDAWSMGIFLADLDAAYTAGADPWRGDGSRPALQYADFASWQQQDDQGGQLAYWRDRLAGLAPLELLTDRPRGAQRDPSGALLALDVPETLARSVLSLAGDRAATPFMVLLAAFQVLLARHARRTDVAVGTPVAGRTRPETEELLGLFTNTLVIRSDLAGDPRFVDLLEQVRTVTLEAFAHQDVPFEHVVDAVQPERDLSRNPLFQIMFDVQHLDRFPPTLGGAAIEPVRSGPAVSKFDLSLTVQQRAGGRLRCVFEYATELFDRSTVERLAGQYLRLLTSIVDEPRDRLGELDLLTDDERHLLLRQWPGSGGDLVDRLDPVTEHHLCVPQLFEERARRAPLAPAVVFGPAQLTYAQLDDAANRFARRLRGLGVTTETTVAVCLERSLDAVVVLLGVLKAGGVYTPLDPTQPVERRDFMISDSGARVVVTTRELAPTLDGPYQVVAVDDEPEQADGEPGGDLTAVARPGNLAYLIYTSGSTGRPKAVMIEHRAYAHHCRVIADAYRITPGDRVVLLSALTFDVAMDQIAATLLAGATIVVSDPVFWAPADLPARLAEHQVTIMEITPAYYREMLEYDVSGLERLALMNVGSDVVTVSDARRWAATGLPGRFLCNYGPTEATVTCFLHPVENDGHRSGPETAALPIGRPVAGTRAYVLDPDLRPVPVGVPGELCLGGVRLARGYHGRPELTARQFVPDPLSGAPGARLYRTGDLVRYRPDGAIEFLGRIDQQVKIRGLRMEIGEIEAALARHPAVQAAAVVAAEVTPGDKGLAAYLVLRPGDEPSTADLREHLRGLLPENMVPSWWTVLPELPMTSSKKVDRRALPAPTPGAGPASRAPATATEQLIAGIWQEVLGLDEVGVDDDFFAVGGHSLLATRVLARLRRAFAVEFPLRRLFEARTVAQLAEAVTEAVEADVAALSDAELEALLAGTVSGGQGD